MSFWTSYNTEFDWDHLFVEAHTVGQDDWTTLEDRTATHTTRRRARAASPRTAQAGGARSTRSWITTRRSTATDCVARTGRPATGGRSAGTPAAGSSGTSISRPSQGKQIEVSITLRERLGVQGLGVFVDDIVVSTGRRHDVLQSGDDGWAMPARSRRQRAQLQHVEGHRPRPASPRGPSSRPRHALLGLRLRGHHRRARPATRSWVGRWTSC